MKIAPSSEHALHLQVVQWLKLARPKIGGVPVVWWTVDQTALNSRHGRTLKNKGVRPGVPDLSFVLPPVGRAAYIELKSSAGKQTESQVSFENDVRMAGALYALCRSLGEVEGTLQAWGVLKEKAA